MAFDRGAVCLRVNNRPAGRRQIEIGELVLVASYRKKTLLLAPEIRRDEIPHDAGPDSAGRRTRFLVAPPSPGQGIPLQTLAHGPCLQRDLSQEMEIVHRPRLGG